MTLTDKELETKLKESQNNINKQEKIRDKLKEEYSLLWKESALRKSNKLKK
jgi:hypothetical protein